MNVFVVAMGLTRDKIRDTHVVGVGVIDEYPLLKAEGWFHSNLCIYVSIQNSKDV